MRLAETEGSCVEFEIVFSLKLSLSLFLTPRRRRLSSGDEYKRNIPIKLPECDDILSHGDDSDTTEDDDDDDDERKGDDLDFCFTLDREKKGTAGKENEEEEERPLLFFSLSLSLSLSCANARLILFDAFSLLARLREFSPLGFSFVRPSGICLLTTTNSFFLKTKRRTTRSARRGDETHHETRERNERVGFARVIEGGASRGVLFAATRMAFGVEEFDAQSVAENRVGEIRESTVGVLLRVLSGDFSRVGDRG
jgi:hypothetical protein